MVKDTYAPDDRLTRADLAEALTGMGFPITRGTLDTMASRGGGPPYQLWSGRALYVWRDALAWAERRLSAPKSSTSEIVGLSR